MKKNIFILFIIIAVFSACKKYDTVAPIITLKGEATVYVPIDSAYNEPGANVSDNDDKNLNYKITGSVNIHKAGTYTLTYTANDAGDNYALPIRRTVIVYIPFSSIYGSYTCQEYQHTIKADGTLSTDSTFLQYSDTLVWWNRPILLNVGGYPHVLAVEADLSGPTSQDIFIPEKVYYGYRITGRGRISDDAKQIHITYVITDSFYHAYSRSGVWIKN
ncbi:MAG: DUF5011 domain-containing protein [Bacteroidota bacterium]|nr:DUF5011 domain-containing protein [Bacteroidota bacterium]